MSKKLTKAQTRRKDILRGGGKRKDYWFRGHLAIPSEEADKIRLKLEENDLQKLKVIDTSKDIKLERLKGLLKSLGFNEAEILTAEHHDKTIEKFDSVRPIFNSGWRSTQRIRYSDKLDQLKSGIHPNNDLQRAFDKAVLVFSLRESISLLTAQLSRTLNGR